jgi:hypothetical protein
MMGLSSRIKISRLLPMVGRMAGTKSSKFRDRFSSVRFSWCSIAVTIISVSSLLAKLRLCGSLRFSEMLTVGCAFFFLLEVFLSKRWQAECECRSHGSRYLPD